MQRIPRNGYITKPSATLMLKRKFSHGVFIWNPKDNIQYALLNDHFIIKTKPSNMFQLVFRQNKEHIVFRTNFFTSGKMSNS